MSGMSECFTVGSVVSCHTCYNKHVQGEVVAFDQPTNMLVLKCPASNGRSTRNDVFFVNLSHVGSIQIVSEAPAAPVTPISLNIDKISIRLRNQLEEKKRLITALNSGLPPEGQKLFLAISKTVPEISWSGENIVVYNNVIIKPPYKTENMLTDGEDGRALLHIRKIVEKHIKENSSVCPPSGN